jgi:AcrR family transcriptional regulator
VDRHQPNIVNGAPYERAWIDGSGHDRVVATATIGPDQHTRDVRGPGYRDPGAALVAVGGRPPRPRAGGTRRLLLGTAERLFAEHGIAEVSNRQVAEAAGQGNNSAVAYHVGTKTDLVVQIVRRHEAEIDRARASMLDRLPAPAGVLDYLACLVRPVTGHLAGLGVPSWYARFAAQAVTDPGLHDLVGAELAAMPAARRAIGGLLAGLGDLPTDLAALRADMTRLTVVHTCAERERALAAGSGRAPHDFWSETGDALIDALAGVLTAPVAAGR